MSKEYTITFDEGAKGWTSFHSFIPDWMQKLNNRFFSVKNGQLYLHNDENSNIRNNFYGSKYPTKITTIFNDEPSVIKFAKTIKLEANKPFDVSIKSYINDETVSITQTKVAASEFINKEGLQYAYFRGNELVNDFSAKNLYGVGRVQSVLGSVLTMATNVPLGSIAVGDKLLDTTQNTIGKIISYSGNTITLNTTPTIPINTFIFGYKNPRIEGSEIRGYNFEVELTDKSSTRTEIFAVNLGMAKSFPS